MCGDDVDDEATTLSQPDLQIYILHQKSHRSLGFQKILKLLDLTKMLHVRLTKMSYRMETEDWWCRHQLLLSEQELDKFSNSDYRNDKVHVQHR